jgi:hypothetical protein
MDSPACPNCGTSVPLQGADDEWCEACGKKLPLAVVAAVHAAAKRLRKAQAAAAAQNSGAEASATPDQPALAKSAKRFPGCAIFLFAAGLALVSLTWLAMGSWNPGQ